MESIRRRVCRLQIISKIVMLCALLLVGCRTVSQPMPVLTASLEKIIPEDPKLPIFWYLDYTPDHDPDLLIHYYPPGTRYVVSQGHHGFGYDHLAIDTVSLDADPGNGIIQEIVSPINGWLDTELDEYGNTHIIITNDVYEVIILHSVPMWSGYRWVWAGEHIGGEYNNGYTMRGDRECHNRDCGWHVHISIKKNGEHVNLEELYGKHGQTYRVD